MFLQTPPPIIGTFVSSAHRYAWPTRDRRTTVSSPMKITRFSCTPKASVWDGISAGAVARRTTSASYSQLIHDRKQISRCRLLSGWSNDADGDGGQPQNHRYYRRTKITHQLFGPGVLYGHSSTARAPSRTSTIGQTPTGPTLRIKKFTECENGSQAVLFTLNLAQHNPYLNDYEGADERQPNGLGHHGQADNSS